MAQSICLSHYNSIYKDSQMDTKERFAAALRYMRKTSGLSQEKFGEKIGFSRTTIAKFEQGKNETVPIDLLILAAKEAGVCPNQIFGMLLERSDLENSDVKIPLLDNFSTTEALDVLSVVAKNKELFLALSREEEFLESIKILSDLDRVERVNIFMQVFSNLFVKEKHEKYSTIIETLAKKFKALF